MKKLCYCYLVFLLFFFCSPVQAKATTCHDSKFYFVIERENTNGEVGNEILVKYKSQTNKSFSCVYSVKQEDFELPKEMGQYFLKLQDDLLFVDVGTSSNRSLNVWDLKQRKIVFVSHYAEPYVFTKNKMSFWTYVEKGNEKNCKKFKKWNAEQMAADIERKVVLDLKTMHLSNSSEQRCMPRE